MTAGRHSSRLIVYDTRPSELTIIAQPASNAAPARLKIRKNTEALSPRERTDFRRVIKQSIALK
jgi:hypothetical protein